MRYICGGKEVAWQKRFIGEVSGQVPEDSWYQAWIKKMPHESVWIYEGDLAVDFWDLDWSEDENRQGQEPSLLIVKGNLVVKGSIINRNTDGAIGLVVLGDLQAEHMTVGGQQIYVAGNLKVNGLLFGSYNHGNTMVKGDVEAYALICDDYCFEIAGKQSCTYRFEVGDEYMQCESAMLQPEDLFVADVFDEDFYDGHDAEDDWDYDRFNFAGLVELLEKGTSPFK